MDNRSNRRWWRRGRTPEVDHEGLSASVQLDSARNPDIDLTLQVADVLLANFARVYGMHPDLELAFQTRTMGDLYHVGVAPIDQRWGVVFMDNTQASIRDISDSHNLLGSAPPRPGRAEGEAYVARYGIVTGGRMTIEVTDNLFSIASLVRMIDVIHVLGYTDEGSVVGDIVEDLGIILSGKNPEIPITHERHVVRSAREAGQVDASAQAFSRRCQHVLEVAQVEIHRIMLRSLVHLYMSEGHRSDTALALYRQHKDDLLNNDMSSKLALVRDFARAVDRHLQDPKLSGSRPSRHGAGDSGWRKVGQALDGIRDGCVEMVQELEELREAFVSMHERGSLVIPDILRHKLTIEDTAPTPPAAQPPAPPRQSRSESRIDPGEAAATSASDHLRLQREVEALYGQWRLTSQESERYKGMLHALVSGYKDATGQEYTRGVNKLDAQHLLAVMVRLHEAALETPPEQTRRNLTTYIAQETALKQHIAALAKTARTLPRSTFPNGLQYPGMFDFDQLIKKLRQEWDYYGLLIQHNWPDHDGAVARDLLGRVLSEHEADN